MTRRVALTFALAATALIASAVFAPKPSPAVVTLGSDLAAEPDIFWAVGIPASGYKTSFLGARSSRRSTA
jgi:hypothetical protein